MKSKLFLALATVIVSASALVGAVHAAGSASLTLSPNSGSYTQNDSFTVAVHENGDNVNVVTAKLTYDAVKLTCNGIGGGAFSGTVSATCGGGSITISRYTDPGTTVSGDQVVGTVNFTATAIGTANVSFASGSQIASNGSNVWNSATTGGSYTISAPAVTPPTPPAQGGSGSTGNNSGSNNSAGNSNAAASNNASVAGASTDQTPTAASSANSAASTPSKETKAATTKATVASKKSTSNKANNFWLLGIVLVLVLSAVLYYRKRPGAKPVVAAPALAKAKTAVVAKKKAPATIKKTVAKSKIKTPVKKTKK